LRGLEGTTGTTGPTGYTGPTGPTLTALIPDSETIGLTSATNTSYATGFAESSVPKTNTILIQGYQATDLTKVVGLTDLFVTAGTTYWNINLGALLIGSSETVNYTIYYYGT
jgi:hypothetical protein